jgi:prepilin peptidase CpaA
MMDLIGPESGATTLLFCIAPVVFLATWTDLKEFRIPNALPIVGLVVFALTCMVFLPLSEVPDRLLGGLIVFAVCFVLFSARAMGGGDAKLLPVIALFIPAGDALMVLIILSVCGLAGVLVIRLVAPRAASLPLGAAAEWQVWSSRKHFPYAYAMAGTLALYILIRLIR